MGFSAVTYGISVLASFRFFNSIHENRTTASTSMILARRKWTVIGCGKARFDDSTLTLNNKIGQLGPRSHDRLCEPNLGQT